MPMLFIFTAGFLMGVVHALTGPDHMSALITVAVNERCRAFFLGARWGIGHSGGLLIVTILMLVLRDTYGIDEEELMDQVSAAMNWFVGVAMLALGLWSYYRACKLRRAYLAQDGKSLIAGGRSTSSRRCVVDVKEASGLPRLASDIELTEAPPASGADEACGERCRLEGAKNGHDKPSSANANGRSASGGAPRNGHEHSHGHGHGHEHGAGAIRCYERHCRWCPQGKGAKTALALGTPGGWHKAAAHST